MAILPILLFPLLGALVNGLFGGRFSKRTIAWVGVGSVGLSLLWMLLLGGRFFSSPEGERAFVETLYTWMSIGTLKIPFALRLDALSMVMIAVVTFVGFFIHLYSSDYMKDDPGFGRYFAYLNLFMTAMLLLVLADNFLLMFIGWEGVGLCSYLLIGFWYMEDVNANAGKKAFLVNRIGDLGFLVGMFCIVYAFGTLSFHDVLSRAPEVLRGSAWLVHAIPLLLFVGATGKSAQIPLYVWLPDAMQGPTPVSALIHAATMVTAGVYMVARVHPLYLLSPPALFVVTLIGVLTLLLAASIALVQNDMKRVLAYSTISQLGYMFAALGAQAFSYGVFHVFTHAFFKACLFLGSGVVMHALHGELDVQKMGGLKQKMPLTYWTFLVGALALSGIFPFAGFFSKDAILSALWIHYGPIFWALGVLGAFMTAFYMFRVIFLAFHGETRLEKHTYEHLHDASPKMAVALVVLALGSLVSGFVEIPGSESLARFSGFLSSVLPMPHHEAHASPIPEFALMAVSLGVALFGILLAYVFYLRYPGLPYLVGQMFSRGYRLLWNKYWVDEIYNALVVRPIVLLAQGLWRVVDVFFIDGLVNAMAYLTFAAGAGVRVLQNGNVQFYALMAFASLAVLVVCLTFLL